ncbi:MAG: DUF1684 domain-containing protein [Chitinophagales bacterium]
MNKIFLLLIAIPFWSIEVNAQDHASEIVEFQNELNESFRSEDESPLTEKAKKKFKGLKFFPINEEYRVEADFVRIEDAVPFQMQTTTDRLPTYEQYGIAAFTLEGKTYQLIIYQSHQLREMEEYKNHLFLPFKDLTSGNKTYGGGRFMDLEIPEGDKIIIDFNKAYNPYCAYNHHYSCPIPPKENYLDIKVLAGVKKYKK